jgi:type VI secretion system protein ImpG
VREGDRGTEVYLRLVDLKFDPRLPAEATLVIKTTCTNRDQPRRLQEAGERLAFSLETVAPLSRIRCVVLPTAPLRPALRRGAQWRLVSHLSLNHLSLTDPAEGRQALQEILRLYDYSDPEGSDAATSRQLIEGITSVHSRRVVGWIMFATGGDFCRGVEVTIELDEQNYLGTGVMMFASLLERFLGLYASMNSFTQLVARTQGGGAFKTWAPRAGEHPMI